MRRRLRLRHLPCLCRRSLAREGRLALADGGGHAGFRLRRAAEFAAVVPDQGQRRTRRAGGLDPGAASLRPLQRDAALTPRRSHGSNLAMMPAVSGAGLRVLSSISTLTDCADATHLPSQNTT